MKFSMRFAQVLNKAIVQSSETFYSRLLSRFPGDMSLAFSYGSGIFPQNENSPPLSNMLDLIFVVRDPRSWHSENMRMNKLHYWYPMRYLGPNYAFKLMENYGAGIYYNTGIRLEGRMIKYGVISEDTIVKDLLNWNTLYLAGRLHKPVNIVHHDFENSPKLLEGLKLNLISAVLSSLLILPESFTEMELYHTLAGLSYAGDFRMTFGEDRNKVSNIVVSNLNHFKQLYEPVLKGICEESDRQKDPFHSFIHWKEDIGVFEQDKSPLIQLLHLNRLPFELQLQICRLFDLRSRHVRDVEEILKSAARYPDLSDVVKQSVIHIVQHSSKSQSLKGIVTAGPWTSVKYSATKLRKMMAGLFSTKKKKQKLTT
uniref:phosphatidate cytidylyltransferase, mitochondrial n=1 Tax=Ciona intestinalis TaxID=7719 RepID=UPI000180CC43|nr:phosphatidate cytidylyltransferase, mitochondrial [Ciona intestinalis]|eukprot:XP_026692182.1 phosphatidate cytidylyltransferase, mitochondrial [Ciona intestinalis]